MTFLGWKALAAASLICTSICGAADDPSASEIPRNAAEPDPTGSLPAEVYPQIAALVHVSRESEGRARTVAVQRLMHYCAAGRQTRLNVLYAARRIDATILERAVGLLRERDEPLPPLYQLVSRFDLADLPVSDSAPFVRVVVSWGGRTRHIWGFRLNQGPGSSILDSSLAKRDGWLTMEPDPRDTPLIPARSAAPFREFCRRNLAEDMRKKAWWNDHGRSSDQQDYVFELCALAHWSFARGSVAQAMALYDRAVLIFNDRRFQKPDGATTLARFTRSWLVTNSAHRAIFAAEAGESWSNLRKRWSAIVRLRGNKPVVEEMRMVPAADIGISQIHDSPTADEMLKRLDRLLAEPRKRTALPMPTDRKKLASYWAAELIESRAGRKEQGSHAPSLMAWGPNDDPARKLIDVGWDAIPAVLERLHDPRPSRGHRSYYSRFTGRSSFTVTRVASIAFEIFVEITGQALSPDEAKKWWVKAQLIGPEKYYLDLLKGSYWRDQDLAARGLLVVNANRHISTLLKRASEEDGSTITLLHRTRKCLEPRHAVLLEPFLSDDSLVVRRVAGTLLARRCKDPRGMAIVVGQVGIDIEGEPHAIRWNRDDVMRDVSSIGSSRAVDALCKALTGDDPKWRYAALNAAAGCPDPRVLAALLTLKANTERHYPKGWSGEERVCDRAVSAIRFMLDRRLTGRDRIDGDHPKVRDRLNAEMYAWVKANRATIDWEAHRKRIRAND